MRLKYFVIPLILLPYPISCLDLRNWQSKLKENKPIYQISLPGTHDSAASIVYVRSFMKRILHQFWQTQDLNLR